MKTLIMLLLLIGCSKPFDPWSPESVASIARRSKCIDWQLEMVRKQVEICNKTTYTSSYCYDSAIVIHCPLIQDEVKE